MKDILAEITRYRESRGWTEYQLAERSGLPQSTISSWYRRKMMPSLPSLEKVCGALGITLSQLLAEDEKTAVLSPREQELLRRWSRLSDAQKQEAVDSMVRMTDIAEKEAAAEVLLQAKGFQEAVVSINGDAVDVVINAAELSDAQRAQIEDIVKRKTDIAAENIVISTIVQ